MAGKRILSDSDVQMIRAVYQKRKELPTYLQLAKKYGVAESTIYRVSSPKYDFDKALSNLSVEQMIEIREVCNTRRRLPSVLQMAKHYEVKPCTIWDIIRYETYKNVPDGQVSL